MKVSQLVPSIRFEVEKPYEEKLRRAKELIHIFGTLAKDKACVSCSFGKDSVAVLHMALQEFPDILVVFNNMGVQYPETYQFKSQLVEAWNLNLVETKPIKSFWKVAEEHGLDDSRKLKDSCCDYIKEIPFRQLVKKLGLNVCFTGLTALESRHRMWVTCDRGQYYHSRKDGITKIHPIVFWTPEDVLRYHRENGIPLNPAYEKYNLQRMGCVPCTSHKYWREQLARVNPRLYKYITKRFFQENKT